MLTQLSIENFKAWRNTGNIRLAPITVFFGSNSAGKTSLLQFLLMLRQSCESRDRKRVFHPGDENTDVDLGTYRDLVHLHEPQREIAFSLDWTLPETLEVFNVLAPPKKKYHGKTVRFEAKVKSNNDATRQYMESFAYTLGDQANRGLWIEMARKPNSGKYEVRSGPYDLERIQGRPWPFPEPLRFYGFPEEVLAYFQNAGFTNDLVLSLEQQLSRIQYLGPLRQRPQRTYSWAGQAPEGVGFDGRHAIPAILAAAGRHISPGFKKKKTPFLGIVAGWLKELGLLENFDARLLAKASKQYDILVEATGTGVKTNLPDVGFGVSQVLPVIVESFYAEPDSTIVIEQPELHLHPRVQAFLADLFVEAISSREDGKDRRIQFLIESHSEHFVYRLQRLIAEGKVKPEQVALYFCRSSAKGSVIESLQLDADGEISNWPENFFGNEMEDVRARLEAAVKRMDES